MNKIPDPKDFGAPVEVRRKSTRTLEREEAKNELSFLDTVICVVIAALALTSGYWTFEGTFLFLERSWGATLQVALIAALLAVVVTLTQATLWWVIIFVLPRIRSARGISLGIALAIVVQVWALGTSSLSNAINLTSGPAILANLEEAKTYYAKAITVASNRVLALKQSLPALTASAKSWCEKAIAEKVRGGITGSAGEGAVSGELDGLCTFSTEIAQSASRRITEAERRSRDVQTHIVAMDRALNDTTMSIFQRETAFLDIAGQLDVWLRDTRANDFSKGLVTAVEVMSANVAGLPTSEGSFGNRQQVAIAGFKQAIVDTVRVYEGVVADIDAMPLPEIDPLERSNVVDATLNRAYENLPLIATAIGVDCAQLLAVLFLALAQQFVVNQPPRRRV